MFHLFVACEAQPWWIFSHLPDPRNWGEFRGSTRGKDSLWWWLTVCYGKSPCVDHHVKWVNHHVKWVNHHVKSVNHHVKWVNHLSWAIFNIENYWNTREYLSSILVELHLSPAALPKRRFFLSLESTWQSNLTWWGNISIHLCVEYLWVMLWMMMFLLDVTSYHWKNITFFWISQAKNVKKRGEFHGQKIHEARNTMTSRPPSGYKRCCAGRPCGGAGQHVRKIWGHGDQKCGCENDLIILKCGDLLDIHIYV